MITRQPCSTVESLVPLFAPRSVAVIGASRTRGTVGGETFHNLLSAFRGPVFPINLHAAAVESVPAFRNLRDVPASVDLAVIAVPGTAVEAALDDCIAKGVRAVVVLSAGFGETGAPGAERERRLRDAARGAGLRLVGPNCLGVMNTDPAVGLNATFAPALPPAGPVAFSSQSGALGLAVLDYARRLGLGVSSFVSVGNKADVSTNDLLEFWERDPRTSVILLYVESFGNPRRFGEIARRVGCAKPVVALKAGRSTAGARAALSHTGALAASDVMVDALFRDAGVIRAQTLAELFDVATLLAHQPLPAGPRVAILTNAGGPGILAADACAAHGLTTGPLTPHTEEALRALLPPGASVTNPIDMIATATADHYRRAMAAVLADPGVDTLIVIFTPGFLTRTHDSATAIAEAAARATKPVLAVSFGATGAAAMLDAVPCFTFPESAVRAVAHAVAYARWRAAPPSTVPHLAGVDVAAARAVMRESLAPTVPQDRSDETRWLTPRATDALLRACAIPSVPTEVVDTLDAALAAARHLGYPVVLKGGGPTIVHKTDAHAVITGIDDDAALTAAFLALARRADIAYTLVQPMLRGGVEMLVGATLDPMFGPAVVCGAGGTLVELLGDVACRLAPLTERAAQDMLDELRGIARLRGFRGAPRLAEGALRDVVLRVSALVHACPEVLELDLNPVVVTTTGALVLDARVRVGSRHAGR
jgi:acetyl coenzyme A synthetase (ADP forming)-like protein